MAVRACSESTLYSIYHEEVSMGDDFQKKYGERARDRKALQEALR